MIEKMLDCLQSLLESDEKDAIRFMAKAIKSIGVDVEIIKDDEQPESFDQPDCLWVVSNHQLVINDKVIAEWIRGASGTYGEPGRQCSDDDWCVSEDGENTLPENVAIVLDIFNMKDDIPTVPEPLLATEFFNELENGEYAVYWETVCDDERVVARYSSFEAAKAVCSQYNREFNARNGGSDTLCGFGVRCLVDNKWIVVDNDND